MVPVPSIEIVYSFGVLFRSRASRLRSMNLLSETFQRRKKNEIQFNSNFYADVSGNQSKKKLLLSTERRREREREGEGE